MSGTVLVQPYVDASGNSTDFCNLAIKVDDIDDNRTQFDRIDYVIYRGIRRSSFLTAAITPTLLSAASTNSELVASIWASYTKAQQDTVQLGLSITFAAPTADWLGFNRTDATQTLEAAFADTTRLAPLAAVTAGKSLGTFASNIDAGIEFVVFDRFYQPTIGDLRKPEMVFEVVSSPTSVAGHDNDYVIQRTRENILNYIDPVAYYTMHYRLGVRYKDTTGTINNTGQSITSLLVAPFVPSHNRLYIDIRNELGGSLNFYRDNEGPAGAQDQHFKYGFDVNSLASANYYTFHWPIFSLVVAPSAATSGQLLLQVRKSHNPKPLLFLDYGYPSGSNLTQPLVPQQRFTDLANGIGNTSDWSAILTLKLLVTNSNTAQDHPIWFVKLMNIRQEVPANLATTVPSAPARHYALDNVFGPIRGGTLVSGANTNVVLPGKKYLTYVGARGGAIVQIRRLTTPTEITFKATPIFMYEDYEVSAFFPAFLYSPSILYSPNVFNSSNEDKWALQPGIITKQVTVNYNGSPVTMLRENYSITGGAFPAVSPSITLSIQQVQNYLLPALAPFSTTRDEAFLVFTDVTREHDDNAMSLTVENSPVPVTPKVRYITAHVKLASLRQNEQYSENATTGIISCFTLDSITFVTDGTSLGLSLASISSSDSYISINKLIQYVKSIEETYAIIDDEDGLLTSARIRSHYYGSNIPPVIDTMAGGLLSPASTLAKGMVFDRAVDRAPANRGLGAALQLTPIGREAYRRLLSHADENGLSGNPSPYILIHNSTSQLTDYIDLGHALYGFEAWQWGLNGTSETYHDLPYSITESPDLAGLPGDLAPAIGEFVNRLHNSSAYQDRAYYPATDDLEAFYQISNPDADFLSDADGLGLSNAFNNLPSVPSKRPKLSRLLEVYYAEVPFNTNTLPGLKNHYLASHYSRRWLRLAIEYRLLRLANANLSMYDVRQSFYWIEDHWMSFSSAYGQLYSKVRAVANVIYNGEVSQASIAAKILGIPISLSSYLEDKLKLVDIMSVGTKSTIYPDVESVINAVITNYFLPSLKTKLVAENSLIILQI